MSAVIGQIADGYVFSAISVIYQAYITHFKKWDEIGTQQIYITKDFLSCF